MMKKAFLPFLAISVLVLAAWLHPGAVPPSMTCGSYVGVGDVAANNGFAAPVSWWDLRAYSSATCGNPLVRVSVSGVQADLSSSTTTGQLVPQTVNGSVCPNPSAGVCIVTKQYDLTQGNKCSSASCDMIGHGSPSLISGCVQSTYCIYFPSGMTDYLQIANAQTTPQPLTLVANANQLVSAAASVIISDGGQNDVLDFGATAGQAFGNCGGTPATIAPSTYYPAVSIGRFDSYVASCPGSSSFGGYATSLVGGGVPVILAGTAAMSGNTYMGLGGNLEVTTGGVFNIALDAGQVYAIQWNIRGFFQTNGPPVAGWLPNCSWNGVDCPPGIKFRDFSNLSIPRAIITPGQVPGATYVSNALGVNPSVNIGGTLYGYTENSTISEDYLKIASWTAPNLFASSWAVQNAGAPIISASPGQWDDHFLVSPKVLWDGATAWLYYCGTNASGSTSIGLATATSPAATSFTKYVSNPIIGPLNCNPFPLDEGGVHYMFVSTNYSAGGVSIDWYTDTAAGGDRKTWVLGGTALTAPISTDWNFTTTEIVEETISKNSDGFFEMTYTVVFATGVQATGYAVSPTITGPYFKFADSPILYGCYTGCQGDITLITSGGQLLAFGDTTTSLPSGNFGSELHTMTDFPVPPCSMSYSGPGDISPAIAWAGLRPYSHATCGAKFANVCVQVSAVDTCADMFTSAGPTGAVVPLSIGGTTCPEATGACTFAKLYDQPNLNNCSGSCDLLQPTVANRFQFLTAASGKCGSAAYCMYGANARMASAGNMTLTQPYSLSVTAYFGNFNASTPNLLTVNNTGIVNNGVNANHYYYSCNNVAAGAVDIPTTKALYFLETCVGGTTAINVYQKAAQSISESAGVQNGTILLGSLDTVNKIIQEAGVWNNDQTSNFSSAGANAAAYWGF